MKLNFWQWLGILLLLGGVLVYAYDKGYFAKSPVQTVPATTAPVP